MRPTSAAALLALLAAETPALATEVRVSASTAAKLDQVAAQLRNATENLAVVETQYAGRADPSNELVLEQRFSDGEIQYLLQDWPTASVLFYDLLADKAFDHNPRRPDALWYLSDALYQQKSYGSARLYLRELLQQDTPRYREALGRYLDVTSKLNDWGNIEPYLAKARGPDGQLPPDVQYVYAKWMARRTELPAEERRRRAAEAFQPLTAQGNRFRLPSLYFLAVLRVQAQDYAGAMERFGEVVAATPADEREQRIVELGHLGLARLLVETGNIPEAVNQYQAISQDSPAFPEALYEMAWAKVRVEDWAGARNAADILLLVAPESPLAPEAQILEGHLLLKLKKYQEATETYNGVISTYAPVRDEIDRMLAVQKDPVAYFDNLLARNEKTLDVNTLLPPLALKWASAQEDVGQALRVVGALEGGKKGVTESRVIAERILKSLDERGAEAFPSLQEGTTRAEAVANGLASAESTLDAAEVEALDPVLTHDERLELGRIQARLSSARTRLGTLPSTPNEVAARRARMQGRMDAMDREAFRLGTELQSMTAMLVATQKWVADTRAQRRDGPEDEKQFTERLLSEQRSLQALETEVGRLRGELIAQRGLVDTTISGEDALRQEMAQASSSTRGILSGVEPRVTGEGTAFLGRTRDLRTQIATLQARTTSAQTLLRDRVRQKGAEIREKVVAEARRLDGYGKDVNNASGNAQQLVGRMAYDSFHRVRRQFYDLVLKADVGVVDTAFTRKQSQTSEIQKVASQKEEELRALDQDFQPLLKDVD
ncbi:MAG TPA: tetratricopeptide repeat protein [Myxococcaceae bacterium]|nr:tetratricopeptide repeat protein [Myxococcaceae bacterium]